jgi:hypothetical protein
MCDQSLKSKKIASTVRTVPIFHVKLVWSWKIFIGIRILIMHIAQHCIIDNVFL